MPITHLPVHGLTLYSHVDDHYSHRIRLILAEKQVDYRLILLDDADEDVVQLNPYGTLPMLVDSQVKLFHCASMAEYIDDRYRQPRLTEDTPAQRALQRQLIWRIESDWFKNFDCLLRHLDTRHVPSQAIARQELRDILTHLDPVFSQHRYFLSEQFSLIDCSLAPVFYRLPQLEIISDIRQLKGLMLYCRRLFERDSFRQSLTEHEQRRYAKTMQWLLT